MVSRLKATGSLNVSFPFPWVLPCVPPSFHLFTPTLSFSHPYPAPISSLVSPEALFIINSSSFYVYVPFPAFSKLLLSVGLIAITWWFSSYLDIFILIFCRTKSLKGGRSISTPPYCNCGPSLTQTQWPQSPENLPGMCKAVGTAILTQMCMRVSTLTHTSFDLDLMVPKMGISSEVNPVPSFCTFLCVRGVFFN